MNITLIGMPASGKTFIGKRVAEHFGLTLIDPDKLIEKEYGLPLQEVLEQLGDATFIQKEAETTLSFTRDKDDLLIATGGSIVYSEHVMQFLKQHSHIVYLKVPIETLTERIDGTPRGIVGADKKTLAELYAERAALYEKWATSTVDANQTPELVAADIIAVIEKTPAQKDLAVEIAEEYEKTLETPAEKPVRSFLLCPVGIVGAGKTMVIKPLARRFGLIRISRDEIRILLKERGQTYERLDEISFGIVRRYVARGYGIAIDSDCVSAKAQKLVAQVTREYYLKSVWIHINPPEVFIIKKLKNLSYPWLFKDADEAIANHNARKQLHEHIDLPFVYTFDTSKQNIDEQLDEASTAIAEALVD